MRTKDKKVPPLHAGKISLVRLRFRYAADLELALSGLNAEISPGAVVDLIGPNTGDKSIFLKLTKGPHQPQDGKVLFDCVEIRRHRPIALRRAIGRFPHNFDLIYGKIRQKLLLSMPIAHAENLEQAAPSPPSGLACTRR
jgi:ABC-type bacteriocin/lantibiotic exporter with double-glycine peptidase domain